RRRQGKPPARGSEPGDDERVLHVAADHEELAHRPVDHLHDAVDERDAEGHQAVDHADHHARQHVLDREERVHDARAQCLEGIQSPVLKSGGNTILASLNDMSGFVYWVIIIGGVHCCQYGPSPRENVIVPFQPSNLLLTSALTMSSPLSLFAALIASASSMICA